jgi:hypothetical protein
MNRWIFVLILICLEVSKVDAQTSVLPPAVDALITGTGALAKSAGDTIDLGPSIARLTAIKAAFREALKKANASTPLSLSGLDEIALLCKTRSESGLLKLTAQRNFIQSVSGKIDALGRPSQIDNLSQAVASLFSSQSLEVKGIPDKTALDRASNSIESACEDDFKHIDVAYYAAPEEKKTGDHSLAAFGAVGSLIDTIVGIITPVVVEGAKIIDEQRRRSVVLSYLQTPGVSTQISDSARELAAGVKQSIDAKRQSLAGTFNENLVLLRSKTEDLSKIEACKSLLDGGSDKAKPNGAPNDAFVRCWEAAWAEIATQVANVIKSANDYDQLANAGDTSDVQKNANAILNSMDKITKPGAKVDLTNLWNITVELLAFADKVNTAASADNQKKLNDAIDKLVHSI